MEGSMMAPIQTTMWKQTMEFSTIFHSQQLIYPPPAQANVEAYVSSLKSDVDHPMLSRKPTRILRYKREAAAIKRRSSEEAITMQKGACHVPHRVGRNSPCNAMLEM